MTIMNWSLRPDIATLISDEIASAVKAEEHGGEVWLPGGLMQKVWTFPALGIMMGARNWPEPTRGVVQLLQAGAIAPQTVEDLATLCEPILADGARNAPLDFIAYLFGWSFALDRAVGYSFNSKDGCRAELLPDGYAINPESPQGDLGELKGWLDVARAQQEMDQAAEYHDRDHLGGRIVVHELRRPNPGEGPAIIARCVGTLSGTEMLIEQTNKRLAGMLDAHGVTLARVET